MDYSKLKNAELESLLKERSLPHGGKKKADMVALLVDHDKTNGSAVPAASAQPTAPTSQSPSAPTTSVATASTTGATTAAPSGPAAAAVAAGGTTRADNPLAVPNQQLDQDPATTNDLSVSQDNTTSTSTALPSNGVAAATSTDGAADAKSGDASIFTANLANTDIEAELAKRKARAQKFGIVESDEEAMKALERAKRFGTGTSGEQAAVKGLDEALPERKKRGRGGHDNAGEGSKRQKQGRGTRPRGPERQDSGAKPAAKASASTGGPKWMSEADRSAAEKRKAKFG